MAINPALVVKISANLDELKKQLGETGSLIQVTTGSIEKMVGSLNGDKLIAQAAKVTAAMGSIQTSTLTAAQAADKLELLDRAMDKLVRLGQPVPAQMRNTADALRQVAGATDTAHNSTQKLIDDYVKIFSGDATKGMHGLALGILQDASAITQAVTRIGGASKLTDAEQAKINKTLTEALAKYKAMGQDAPPAMVALAQATQRANLPTASLVDRLRTAVPTMASVITSVQTLALGYVTGALSVEGFLRVSRFVVDFLKESVREYFAADRASQQLTAALRTQGVAVDPVRRQYQALAAEFQRTTTNSSTLTLQVTALLAQIGIMPNQMEAALRAAADLAAGMSVVDGATVDLRTAALLVTKALEGNVGALKRYGITLDESRVAAEGAEYVFRTIEAHFGGQAQAELNSYTGQVKSLGNQWNEFQQSVGEVIVRSGLLSVALTAVRVEIAVQRVQLAGLATAMNLVASLPGPIGASLRTLGLGLSDSTQKSGDFRRDVNLAAEVTLPNFSQQLTAARARLAALTPEQRANIEAALKLNTSTEEIAKTFKVTAGEVAIFRDQLRTHEQAVKDNKKWNEDHAKQLREWNNVLYLAANTRWRDFIGKIGEATLSMPPHLIAAKALAASHKDLGVEVTQAAIAMSRGTMSADEIFKALKAGKQVTDEEQESVTNLVASFRDWDNAARVVPLQTLLDGVLKTTKGEFALAAVTNDVTRAKQALTPEVRMMAQRLYDAGFNADYVFQRLKALGKITDADKPKIEALAKATFTLGDALQQAGQMLAQMAQIGGEAWGPILRGVGQAVVAVGGLTKAMEALTAPGKDGGFNAQNLMAVAAGWVGVVVAVWQVVGAITAANDEAARYAATTRTLIALNKEYASSFSRDLAEAIREAAREAYRMQYDWWERLKGASKAQADLIGQMQNFGRIVEEMGGLTGRTYDVIIGKLQDFVALTAEQGKVGSDAIKAINDQLDDLAEYFAKASGVWDQAFLDLIAKLKESGQEFENLDKILQEQTENAATGLTTFLTTGANAYDALAAKQKELAALQAQYADATPEEQAKIRQAIEKVTAEIEIQRRLIEVTGIVSQAAATAFGAALAGVFAQLVDGGATALDAIRRMQPAIAALETQLAATGLSGGAAFQVLKRFSDLASDAIAGPALDAVAGLGQALAAMNNLGLLNQETFGGLASQIGQTYDELIRQGYDGDAAMRLMQPTLQILWQLQDEFGFQVDEATQKLLDQAAAAGIVGEEQKSMADQMLELAKRMTGALEGIARVFGVDIPDEMDRMARRAGPAVDGVIDEINRVPTDVTIAFRGSFIPPDGYPGPTPQPNFAALGGFVTRTGVEYLAAGGISGHLLPFVPRGTDTVPAMLTPGEGIVNRQGMTALGIEGLRALNLGQAPAAPATIIDLSEVKEEVRRLRSDLLQQQRDLRRALQVSMEDAIALAPRRTA